VRVGSRQRLDSGSRRAGLTGKKIRARLGIRGKLGQRGSLPVRVVDARGALCPVPTVMAALALEAGAAGCVVDVRADDPTTRRDLPLWCDEFGHRVVGVRDGRGEFRVRIQKGGIRKK
jgi:tRNA 2-thiouridine synthesizing protein A